MASRAANHRHTVGITRREVLQVGFSGLLGFGVPTLLTGRSSAAATNKRNAPTTRQARSVIVIFLTGAPSHVDTFDLKPDAPQEVRGTFKPIATRSPGVRICEHLPRLAARADRFAIIRSMTHGLPSHEHATHMVLTGIDKLPPGSSHMASRNDWPCFASGLDYLRPHGEGIPNGVMMPTYLNNGYGFSGQNAGLLGPRHDPWHVKQDPNGAHFHVDNLELPVGLTAGRLTDRRGLLQEMDRQRASLAGLAEGRQLTAQQAEAVTVLTSGKIAQAFALQHEPDKVRDRYGRHMFGQSLLLARRLVQAGVPVVQANMGHMNQWDTHNANCRQLKDRLLPPLDQGVAALLDDLESSGLLSETLVVMLGEFGRTPKLGGNLGTPQYVADGRDHWAGVFFAVMAGAGIQGGQVVGRSDKIAAFPASKAYYPSDLGATIYNSLGVDPTSIVQDRLGRPMQLNSGEIIQALYRGSES